MNITIKCPRCREYSNYIHDKDCEELGFYGFDCPNCKEEFMTPKSSPDIEKLDV